MVRQGVQRIVDRPEGDAGLDCPHAFEDVGGARVIMASAHGIEDSKSLRRHPQGRTTALSYAVLRFWRLLAQVRAHLLASDIC